MERLTATLATMLGMAAAISSVSASADTLARKPLTSLTAAIAQTHGAGGKTSSTADASCAPIPDDGYNGALSSMVCRTVPGLDQTIDTLKLKLGVNHPFVGDLTVKVVNPAGQVATVLSRPGLAESADDGSSCCGDGSGLTAAAPIEFDPGAIESAEDMGAALADSEVICRDDHHCSYRPEAGAGSGTLGDFTGTSGAGNWKVCVGDGENLEAGSLCSASIVINGHDGDLGIDAEFPNGTDPSNAFTLRFTATNHGPSAQTGATVSDLLPSSLSYVSDDCGAGASGNLWNWAIGAMAVDDTRVCNVSVRMKQSGACEQIVTSAKISGDLADSNAANNSVTLQNAGDNLVSDPSMENSGPTAGGAWTSSSTNFGAVFCAQGRCTDNPTETAYSGEWWGWFGGIDPTHTNGATFPETATLAQTLLIPPGIDNLYFQLRMPVCSGNAADQLSVTVDGNVVWQIDGSDTTLCGSNAYAQQVVDIAAYADGNSHTVQFRGVQAGQGGITAFFVDTIAFMAPLTCTAASGDSIFGSSFD